MTKRLKSIYCYNRFLALKPLSIPLLPRLQCTRRPRRPDVQNSVLQLLLVVEGMDDEGSIERMNEYGGTTERVHALQMYLIQAKDWAQDGRPR